MINVTLGIALNDNTWYEDTVTFECDPDFENDSSFNLTEVAFKHLYSQKKDVMDQKNVSGAFLVFWEFQES